MMRDLLNSIAYLASYLVGMVGSIFFNHAALAAAPGDDPPFLAAAKKVAKVERGVGPSRAGATSATAIAIDSPPGAVATASAASSRRPVLTDEKAKKMRADTTAAIGENLLCPITYDYMVDPVVANDGHTYERSAILTHLSTKKTSPMDNITVIKTLTTNFSVKSATEKIIESKGVDEETRKAYFTRKNLVLLEVEENPHLYPAGQM